ncbi:Trp biosynthesis-associated membrane protein [Nesterenkonia marinintestina]|uniref:Trp biosynthesis-associated membrane protein n=1 Tax=Nesterenkonia marinintestina TaxID=2979865 RepID=UPI0021C017A1|nr:Trp biosynthesis-associated membrane protein [Nesterenkonia sp. GX14115]
MRLSRRTVVLAALLAGIVLLLTTTQTWVRASGLGETSALQSVEIAGSDIAQGVAAMGLVVLAGAVAVTIARRVARLIIGLLMVGAAVVSGWSVLQVILEPEEASLAALGEVTGTTEQAQSYELAPAVWAALAASVLLLAAALVLLLGSSRWEESRRYDSQASAAPGPGEGEPEGDAAADEADEFDLWDGLSAGEDPTEGRTGP